MSGTAVPDLSAETLLPYLQGHLPGGATYHSLRAERLTGGQSNPTYLLDVIGDRASLRCVLRRQPPGSLLEGAHDVVREARVLRALRGRVPVPEVFLVCEDPQPLGSPFFLMEFLEGRIFRSPDMPGLSPAERREAYFAAVRTLRQIHSLDPCQLGLAQLTAPSKQVVSQAAVQLFHP